MKAHFDGTCSAGDRCLKGGKILKGEEIQWRKRSTDEQLTTGKKSESWHIGCSDLRGTSTSVPWPWNPPVKTAPIVAVPLADVAEPPAVSIPAQPITIATNNPLADTLAQAIAPYLEQRLTGKVDENQVSAIVDGKLTIMTDTIQSLVKNKVMDVLSTIERPRTIEVIQPDKTTVNVGVQHKQFEELLTLVQTVPNVWISGAAGTGKTSACEAVARALGKPFYFTGAIAEPYSLLGFKSATGEYQRTSFREAYEHGGIFLFDEIDSSEPVAVMPFNAALANGHCAFPDRVVERHVGCGIIASANTWGHGANDSYVGRLKMDGAFIDRFVKVPWTIDESLEDSLAANPAWVSRVRSIRAKVASKGIRVLVTPRASIYGAKLLAVGIPQARVEELCIRNGMTAEQWESVR